MVGGSSPVSTPLSEKPLGGPDVTLQLRIPAEMAQYSDAFRRFFDAMIYKIEKNMHKGRWEDLSLGEAVMRLRDEVIELEAELERGNSIKITLEAADVANFAMMAAAIATERGR